MTQVRVELVLRASPSGSEQWLELTGGDPRGNDTLHKTVSGWAGWRRCPQLGVHNGQSASRYQARAWLAALQPLVASGLAIAWAPAAQVWCQGQLEGYRRRELDLRAECVREDGAPWRAATAGRQPMPHQTQALEAIAAQGGQCLLTDDMGLGKTTTAVLAWLFKGAGPRRALVICPKSVKLNWQDEVQACYGVEDSQIPGRTVPLIYLIDGTPAHRANVIGYMRAAIDENSLAIAIVNYDLLRSMNEVAWRTLEAWCTNQCVIADEFHYCKDRDSKRTKSVQALMSRTVFRLGLTGTPVRNTVEDLFAQIELLRPGTWVSYHDFANRHLVLSQVKFGNNKRQTTIVRGGKNLEELNRVVNTLRIGRKKEDVLSLPPLMRTKPQLELDGLHLDVYKQMKDFARVELEKLIGGATIASEERKPSDVMKDLGVDHFRHGSQIVTGADVDQAMGVNGAVSMWHPLARSAVEAAMRCEMIAQGFLSGLPEQYAEAVAPMIAGKAERVDGYPNAFVFPDSPKMAWLIETVENELRDRPVVIFSRFNAPILWLENKFSTQGGAVKLVGSMDTVARQEAIDAFRQGKQRIMLVQVKLAEGFNLTNASDVLFLGRDWSPAINAQAEARCHRIGSKGTVNVQIPIVHNSVEKFIERKLAAKDADAQQALKVVTLRELLEAL
jgi:SNF2 family DNA or RNA helicase